MSNRVEENGHSPGGTAARSVGQILHDIVTLGQLQAQLFVLDARDATSKVQRPMLALLAGGVLAICAVPLALIGIAFLLIDVAHLSRLAAFWITFIFAIFVAASLVGYAVAWFREPPGLFQCSREELESNIERVKEMLHRSGPPTGSGPPRYTSRT
ncbi:MAG TPA: phage holin family protein [Planctomycetaceae bacterium]|nr:phage holin family protein [Planctomycetaceae bacterium]